MMRSSSSVFGALNIRWATASAARFLACGSILENVTTQQPYSLECYRPGLEPPKEWRDSWWKNKLLALTGYYARKTQLTTGGDLLYKAVTEQADNEQLCKAFGLERAQFMTRYTLLSLHVWLLVRRLKEAGPEGKWVSQVMYDQFQRDTELSVHGIGIQVRGTELSVHGISIQLHLKKHLLHLEKVWYGTSIAYDKALAGDGPPLDDCLLKNVYANDSSKQPLAQLLSQYLLHQERCLAATTTQQVLLGQLRFGARPTRPAGGEGGSEAAAEVERK